MKKNISPFTFALSMSLALFFLASCGKLKEENVKSVYQVKSENNKVGIALASTKNPFDRAELRSLIESGKKNGFKLIVEDAKGKLTDQQADIESLISERIDYLVVAPVKKNGFKGLFHAAHEAEIPIILINRSISGVPGRDFTALIAPDGEWEGQAAAEWLLENKTGRINVIQLVGAPGASITEARTEGFRVGTEKYSRIKILESKLCDFSEFEAYKKIKNAIEIYTQTNIPIDAIFAQNDSMALGAIKALKRAGLKPGKDILIIGIGGQKEAKEAIEKGEMSATISYSPHYGPIVFKNIKDLEDGKKITSLQIIKGKVFDKTNINKIPLIF